jgi:hypothetical protein
VSTNPLVDASFVAAAMRQITAPSQRQWQAFLTEVTHAVEQRLDAHERRLQSKFPDEQTT